jgi:uncharacterized protein YbjT (DUF2867 family)
VTEIMPPRYYTGPISDHFDGVRFFDPLGVAARSRRDLLRWLVDRHRRGTRAKWRRGSGGFLYNVALHLVLGRIYDDKDVQERIVRKSKLDWVIVRPVILTSGPKTKAYRALVDPRDWTCGFISRADVADFLVKQIDNDAFLHKTPVLTS